MLTWNQTKELLSNYTDHTFGPTSVEANLTMVGFQNANLQDADLRYVNLAGVNLQDADLRRVNLVGANLRSANLHYTDLQGANLMYVNLMYVNLMYVNLAGANLQGANLTGANLTSANLTSTNLRGIILLGTKVEGTGIMSFKGSEHFAFYVPWQDYIQIGCVGMHTQEWLQTYEDVAAEYGYTPEQIAEYLGFVQMCANKVGA